MADKVLMAHMEEDLAKEFKMTDGAKVSFILGVRLTNVRDGYKMIKDIAHVNC